VADQLVLGGGFVDGRALGAVFRYKFEAATGEEGNGGGTIALAEYFLVVGVFLLGEVNKGMDDVRAFEESVHLFIKVFISIFE
jgi:hypothetical protein